MTHRFDGPDHPMQTLLKIDGLSDPEVDRVADVLREVAGVLHVEVSAEEGMASVLYDVRADVPVLVAALKQAGYDARAL
ncbi:MAG: heavy metal-associated domain-containing protein [Nitrospiria bacterium]